MQMYAGMFEQVNDLKWKQQYGREEAIGKLSSIRKTLGLKKLTSDELKEIDEIKFSEHLGECGQLILKKTNDLSTQATETLKSIMKEDISFGEERKGEGEEDREL